MAARILIALVFLLSLLPLSSPLPSQTLLNAAEILSDSGFVSMALTLNLLAKTLAPHSSSLTIFSPSDPAFVENGQPTLSLIKFHLSPLPLSLQSLQSLPPSSTIPTLLPNHSLLLTTSASDGYVSLNGVKIDGSPVFDDGSLIIFGIKEFFDMDFGVSTPNPTCIIPSVNSDDHSFDKAGSLLRSRGYSVMASFLGLQLLGFDPNAKALTVFAPLDHAMKLKGGNIGNFTEYQSIFFRHVLPCKFSWADLVGSDDGTMLGTYLEGFKINVTKSGDKVLINEVAIASPDLLFGESIVVHGLQQVLALPEKPQKLADSPSDYMAVDSSEF